MKNVIIVSLLLMSASCFAKADVFNLGPGYTNLETVTVGDPGNASDTDDRTLGNGSVGYNYNIGKYEVTAGQYCDFLNHKAKLDLHVLWFSLMADPLHYNGCNIQRNGVDGSYSYTVASDWANKPVNYVSFWDACRFANWLGNGQGDGDTETGAYMLSGYNYIDGNSIRRNRDWKWAIGSEDEWYKAAYYKGGGTDAGYWPCPTQTSYVDGYLANCDRGRTTDVGQYEVPSAYGTFDQGGNVSEWNEAIIPDANQVYVYRGVRGGSYGGADNYDLHSYARNGLLPTDKREFVGFRVVQAYPPVPEPSSILGLVSGISGLGLIRRKKK